MFVKSRLFFLSLVVVLGFGTVFADDPYLRGLDSDKERQILRVEIPLLS